MCTGCDGITLLKGNGIVSTVDNGDGTFTFTYSDGSTFTTSDLTGPAGPTGATGPAGPTGATGATGPTGPPSKVIEDVDLTTYVSGPGQPDYTYTINTTQFLADGDGLHIFFLTNTVDLGGGNFGGGDLEFEIVGGSPITTESLFTHTYDVSSATNMGVDIYLFKQGANLEGYARFVGEPTFAKYPITCTNFFGASSAVINLLVSGVAASSFVEDVVIEILKT